MFASTAVSSASAAPRVSVRRGVAPKARRCARTSAAAASARVDASSSAASPSPPRDARELLPKDAPSRATLVATVAAKPANAPAPAEAPTPFVAFCRANWGFFAALQTVALIGASYNGRLARKRRLEIAEINAKLRAMMQKAEDARDATRGVDESDDEDGGSSEKLAEGKRALSAKDFEAAVVAFDEAKTIAESAGARAAELSARKGLARALIEAGQIRAAIGELANATELAVEQGDSSVYGMLGDCYTDLAELGEAGRYYDLCLAMD
jgi:tetratricopeptide (TPR) repeat protein